MAQGSRPQEPLAWSSRWSVLRHRAIKQLMESTLLSSISPSDTNTRRASALLLDVRTPAEYTEMHIDGALSHPITELNPDFVRSQTQGQRECIVICRSGGRARKAAETLAAAGITNIKIMDGGMMSWMSAGLPFIEGAKTISLERQVRIAAGSLVFIGALLSYVVHPAWIALSAFVGAGLVFAGITDTCGMGMVLARMPWNNRRPSGEAKRACCSS